MKNFPSSLIRQQSTKDGLGNNIGDTLKNIGTKTLSSLFSNGSSQRELKDIKAKFEAGLLRPELPYMIDELNIFNKNQEVLKIEEAHNSENTFYSNYENGKSGLEPNIIKFEDPFKFSSSIFSVINNYKYVFNYTVPTFRDMGGKNEEKKLGISVVTSIVSPSLFNPFMGIEVTGITENIPLINKEINSEQDIKKIESGLNKNDSDKLKKDFSMTFNSSIYKNGNKIEEDLSNCSIKKLVELSQEGKLGSETYRYQDFMYCKDLGKIPNNRLITLRRFPAPVGDNIYDDDVCGLRDNGRLITWFDNEDNKLENICKYDYRSSWKKFTASIQELTTQDKDTGIASQLANFLSPQNNLLTAKGYGGNNEFLFSMASKLHIPVISDENAKTPYYDLETLTNYDQHKIYEPKNRISSMYEYEGDLEFNQEITLVFRYVLRSYDNINPRAAMLDLLGNIMTVTYTRGKFWGGESKLNGPQGNSAVYDKANNLIDGAFEKIGSVWNALSQGETFDLTNLMGLISNMIDQGKVMLNKAVKEAEGKTGQNFKSTDSPTQTAKKTLKALEKVSEDYNWIPAIKGMLKNQLGRPAIYAFNSLLTGEENGLWHLTIGNPRNPIMSIGNLIIDSPAIIQHYGPLGLDDFPTEMSVTVTLKHQQPRDRVGIEKMYTKGRKAIYQPMNLLDIEKYYKSPAFKDLFKDIDNKSKLRVNLANI